MRTIDLSSYLADVEARAVASGVGRVDVDALRNKGGRRTAAKRAMLAAAGARAGGGGAAAIVSYY